MKKIAILQSNYIPWKGYFDLIAAVDEFILFDEVQYTKNDWRNRNLIKTPHGVSWLTIPVSQGLNQRIRDVRIVDDRWQTKHWKSLEANYRRAENFHETAFWLKPLYSDIHYQKLSDVNRIFIEKICSKLGIRTKISNSSDYKLSGGQTRRLVNLCKQAKAASYVTGPAARNYLDEKEFASENITVEWFQYSSYPKYPQQWGEFCHTVSVVDLLFNCGSASKKYIKNSRN